MEDKPFKPKFRRPPKAPPAGSVSSPSEPFSTVAHAQTNCQVIPALSLAAASTTSVRHETASPASTSGTVANSTNGPSLLLATNAAPAGFKGMKWKWMHDHSQQQQQQQQQQQEEEARKSQLQAEEEQRQKEAELAAAKDAAIKAAAEAEAAAALKAQQEAEETAKLQAAKAASLASTSNTEAAAAIAQPAEPAAAPAETRVLAAGESDTKAGVSQHDDGAAVRKPESSIAPEEPQRVNTTSNKNEDKEKVERATEPTKKRKQVVQQMTVDDLDDDMFATLPTIPVPAAKGDRGKEEKGVARKVTKPSQATSDAVADGTSSKPSKPGKRPRETETAGDGKIKKHKPAQATTGEVSEVSNVTESKPVGNAGADTACKPAVAKKRTGNSDKPQVEDISKHKQGTEKNNEGDSAAPKNKKQRYQAINGLQGTPPKARPGGEKRDSSIRDHTSDSPVSPSIHPRANIIAVKPGDNGSQDPTSRKPPVVVMSPDDAPSPFAYANPTPRVSPGPSPASPGVRLLPTIPPHQPPKLSAVVIDSSLAAPTTMARTLSSLAGKDQRAKKPGKGETVEEEAKGSNASPAAAKKQKQTANANKQQGSSKLKEVSQPDTDGNKQQTKHKSKQPKIKEEGHEIAKGPKVKQPDKDDGYSGKNKDKVYQDKGNGGKAGSRQTSEAGGGMAERRQKRQPGNGSHAPGSTTTGGYSNHTESGTRPGQAIDHLVDCILELSPGGSGLALPGEIGLWNVMNPGVEAGSVQSVMRARVDVANTRSVKDLWTELAQVFRPDVLPDRLHAHLIYMDSDGDWLLVTPDDDWDVIANSARKLLISCKG